MGPWEGFQLTYTETVTRIIHLGLNAVVGTLGEQRPGGSSPLVKGSGCPCCRVGRLHTCPLDPASRDLCCGHCLPPLQACPPPIRPAVCSTQHGCRVAGSGARGGFSLIRHSTGCVREERKDTGRLYFLQPRPQVQLSSPEPSFGETRSFSVSRAGAPPCSGCLVFGTLWTVGCARTCLLVDRITRQHSAWHLKVSLDRVSRELQVPSHRLLRCCSHSQNAAICLFSKTEPVSVNLLLLQIKYEAGFFFFLFRVRSVQAGLPAQGTPPLPSHSRAVRLCREDPQAHCRCF